MSDGRMGTSGFSRIEKPATRPSDDFRPVTTVFDR
jgi:hypothetical protein